MEYSQIKRETRQSMDKAVQHAFHEFSNIHTGKATPSMVDNLNVYVESYGANMELRELAAITTPDNRTIQVQPWDRNTVGAIDKAIRASGLGLNPVDRGGGVIMVPVPELSMERRKELAKVASNFAEEGRIAVRQARHNAMDSLKTLKKEGHVSEDDIKRHEKEIQDMTDQHIQQINEALEAKEKELTTV